MSESGPSLTQPLPFRRTVRARLLLIALLPLLVVLPLLLWVTVANWSKRLDETLIAKVNGELTIAYQYLSGLIEGRGAAVEALARSAEFAKFRASGNDAAFEAFLNAERRRMGLDFLYALNADGHIHPSSPVEDESALQSWPVVRSALEGARRAEIDIFSAEDLSQLSPALAGRARLPLVPTAAAVPTERTEEDRGMVVHVASPAPGGALVGGLLLNRNLAFIDEINDLVYPAESLTEGSIGTATLFLEDVRISTNVRLFEDVRALGTRVSAAVRQRVLGEGQVWLDRAFVVNDWYVSAYEPIVDSYGNRVGMLYVGFLEAPFAEARWNTVRNIGLGFAGMLVVFVPLLLRWARGIFEPLEQMNRVIAEVDAGDLGARSGAVGSEDEIGRVAAHLDDLLARVQQRDRKLRDLNETLEAKVQNRTRDLEEANRQLDHTTRQLIVSEKLAAIGEITAGVAHEINNPLAVIQGNLDVIENDLGVRAEPLRTEFTLINEQIQAIHIIVSKLLQFARPEEFAETGGGNDPDEVIRDTLPLVHHLLTRGRVEIILDLDASERVAMNQTELQQVLVNLIVNAVQAMPHGGKLNVISRKVTDNGQDTVRITVADTGIGMDDATMARVFDPFFTLKRAEGTGLGLSITRNLITRAGGNVTVESELGQGTTFAVYLPVMQDDVSSVA